MNPSDNWRPSASMGNLKTRAQILTSIRHFFQERNILEVETPLLSASTVTDPHLHSMSTTVHSAGASKGETRYLQTSPEYPMKRLLAAGSGPIYQITKAFRDQEFGKHHNPEFTLLEWYRPDYDHHQLMDEVAELLQLILNTQQCERLSYQ